MTSSRVDYDPRLECGDNGDKYEYLCPQWDLARGQHIGRREAANLTGGKCQESACVAIRIDKFYFVSQRRLRIDFDNRAQISCQNAVIWASPTELPKEPGYRVFGNRHKEPIALEVNSLWI